MKIEANYEFDHPAQHIWSIISQGDELKWVTAGTCKVEKTGSGVGMTLKVYWGDRDPFIHHLVAIDHQRMSMRYEIESNQDMPLEDYTLDYQLRALPDQRCCLRSTMEFIPPADADEDEMRSMVALSVELANDNLNKRLAMEASAPTENVKP